MSKTEERDIAQQYIGGFPWFVVVWGLGGFTVWLALWTLTTLGYLPLWLGGIVATVVLCYCYLPSHEAQHGNIGRPKRPYRWLNEIIGHLSMLPLMVPYRLHRALHLKHHAYSNHSEKDPDLYMRADNVWSAMKSAWLSHQPGQESPFQEKYLEGVANKDQLLQEGFWITRMLWLVMLLLAWNGFALELLVLWWIPLQIANIYTPVVLSWAPHHPMEEVGRYRDTRGWKSPVGTLLSSAMEYHLVHHLFPSIPINKTPRAYRKLKPLLEAEGMSLNNL